MVVLCLDEALFLFGLPALDVFLECFQIIKLSVVHIGIDSLVLWKKFSVYHTHIQFRITMVSANSHVYCGLVKLCTLIIINNEKSSRKTASSSVKFPDLISPSFYSLFHYCLFSVYINNLFPCCNCSFCMRIY